MTYAGLATLFFRLLGTLAIAASASVFPLSMPSGLSISNLLGIVSLLMLPGVLLIFISNPLGRFIAAGIE